MQGWHYGKGLIYYRPIFRLTKLALLRARAVQRENIHIAITVPLNKTYFGKKYQEIKNSGISTPSTDTSRLSRDLYRLLKSQPINVRILPQGYCVSIVALTR